MRKMVQVLEMALKSIILLYSTQMHHFESMYNATKCPSLMYLVLTHSMLKHTPQPIERNCVVPEVKIPFIFIIEILIKSHNVVTIQIMYHTPLYCESMVFAPVEATSYMRQQHLKCDMTSLIGGARCYQEMFIAPAKSSRG